MLPTTNGKGAVTAAKVFRAPQTNCPFLAAAGKAELLQYDGHSSPIRRMHELLGKGLGRVAAMAARLNHPVPGEAHGPLRRTRFDPVHLAGSRGDHPGSSRILEGPNGFDPQRFAAFIAHSKDGIGMTRRDLARAIATDVAGDPKAHPLVDKAKSAGEFALLLGLLGKPTNGQKQVRIADMRKLFGEQTLPDGWEETARNASTLGWLWNTLVLTGHALASKRALGRASEDQSPSPPK